MLATVDPGATRTFYMYYGAAPTEAQALSALRFVQAQLYSLGEPSTPNGPTQGTPNTFMFGYRDPLSPGIPISGPIQQGAKGPDVGTGQSDRSIIVTYDPNPNKETGTP